MASTRAARRNRHGGLRERPPRHPELKFGVRLRELRRARRVPLTALSKQAGLSPGYLSLVERDMATPSMTALARLSEALDVPMTHLFDPSAERLPENFVVRRTQRRVVIYPGSTARHELLVPDLRGKLEAVYVRARPGTRSPVYKHDGEDFAHVLKGRLRLTVGDDAFTLERGDSIAYPSHLPHSWEALGAGVDAIFVATPPSW